MELPQSRPFGAEGRKATHDFLSLYSHPSVQQDPRPASQGAYLKTRDFLHLEQQGNPSAKKETSVEVMTVEKPTMAVAPPSVEHILPGGIGTYSIGHISYFNPRVPKSEGAVFSVAEGSSTERNDENSNCSSYTGSGFTLWEESAGKKGKTRKENAEETPFVEATGKVGQWATSSLEKGSQSSTNNHPKSFSCLSSSQPSSNQKRQSFMEMIKSAKGSSHDDYFEEDEDFALKKESSTTTHNIELRVKVDGKSGTDQKANTPRSKHSATEQRRRSKINNRFQMLRDIIPNSDQKRDKASFLLEVIEYIQFLQEKVHKYEGTYQGWNNVPSKLIPWRSNHRPTENYSDQSRAINGVSAPSVVFPTKLDEENINVTPTIHESTENSIEPNTSRATTFRAVDLCPEMMNQTMPFPVSLQTNFLNSAQNTVPATQIPTRLPSDAENSASQPQHVPRHTGSCTTNGALPSEKLKGQELTVEGGTISISSVYSQRLLNTLTQALHTSGLDLSQASIAVQIELGKQTSSRPTAPISAPKGMATPSINQAKTRPRVGEDSHQPLKKLKS